MSVDPLRRRALINGGIATLVTLAIGVGVVMAVTPGASPPPVASPSPSPTTPSPPACVPTWDVAQSADPGDQPNWLSGVAALSGAEAWAVGASGDPAVPTSVLIEGWDGTAWTAEQGPAPGSQVNELRGVDASGPNDVWAVGRTASGFGDRPVVMRFDGTSWTQVELPSEVSGVLNGVAAVSPNDVWVVGYTGDPIASTEHALVLHWDGQLWADVDPGRAVGVGRSALLDVEAATSDDLWVVGYLHGKPLIAHFDGRAWSRSETGISGSTNAIEPVTASNAWAVGSPIQRFDGTAWSRAVELRPDAELFGVAAVSQDDVWAVGVRTLSEGVTKSLVLRFDGRRWTPVDGPGVPGSDALADVDALSDGTVFAVGYKDVEAGRRTLAIRGTTCTPPS